MATQSRKPRVEKMMPTFLCGVRRAVTFVVVITDLRFRTLNVTGYRLRIFVGPQGDWVPLDGVLARFGLTQKRLEEGIRAALQWQRNYKRMMI